MFIFMTGQFKLLFHIVVLITNYYAGHLKCSENIRVLNDSRKQGKYEARSGK